MEDKEYRLAQREILANQGLAKKIPKPEDDDFQPMQIRKKHVPKIGDVKKDKMKHSLAMTNDERE